MNHQDREELKRMLEWFLNESLERILLSHPVDRGAMSKSRLRPLLIKGALAFQAEEQKGKQAFHRNMSREEAVAYVMALLDGSFKQGEIVSSLGRAVILVSKKGKITMKIKRNPADKGILTGSGSDKAHGTRSGQISSQARIQSGSPLLEHNRKKRYILEEGRAVPFLVDLGVMTQEGKL